MFPCGNGIVRNDQPHAYGQLWHWHTLSNCPCTRTARTHSCAIVPVAPVGCLAPVVVGRARPRSTRALIPILLPPSSSAFGANLLPRASSNRLPFHRSPGGNHLIVLASTTPLKDRVRSIPWSQIPALLKARIPRAQTTCRWLQRHPPHSQFVCRLPISINRKSISHRDFHTGGGLDRQLDRSDMPLMTFLPNFLQRRWTAGRPLQTFLVLHHCQANSTALSRARMEGSLSHRNTTLRYPKLSKSLAIVFTTFSQPENFLFCWN